MAETQFSAVYNRFLGQITDDLYLELTPEDTLKDLQNLLINVIPGFEFPRKDLNNFQIIRYTKALSDLGSEDFVISVDEVANEAIVEESYFLSTLSSEEINILAILMQEGWVQRQITSIEVTRMKYSGPDFKMTSQANHLSKLLSLLKEIQRQSLHMQRLYKRRKLDAETGLIRSNWSSLRGVSALDD